MWEQEVATIQEYSRKLGNLIVGGDARCDSMGHSAKYGSYTIVELKQNKVIDLEVVQVRHTC